MGRERERVCVCACVCVHLCVRVCLYRKLPKGRGIPCLNMPSPPINQNKSPRQFPQIILEPRMSELYTFVGASYLNFTADFPLRTTDLGLLATLHTWTTSSFISMKLATITSLFRVVCKKDAQRCYEMWKYHRVSTLLRMLRKIQSIKQMILEVHKTNNFGGNEAGCLSVFHSNQYIS